MEYENLPLQKMGALRLKFTVFPYSMGEKTPAGRH